MKYKSRKFKSPSEEADNIYLTKEELKQFYEHDFSKKSYLDRVELNLTGVRWFLKSPKTSIFEACFI